MQNKMFNIIPFIWKLTTENKLYIVNRYINSWYNKIKMQRHDNTNFRIAVISREK